MVKPIAHDHVGDRAGGIEKEGIRAAVRKLYAVDRLLNNRLVIVFQDAVDPGRQPAAANLVSWMRRLIESEDRQPSSTQLIGSGSASRPNTDNQGIVDCDVG